MEIKIRYTWKRFSDGVIWQEVVDISIIEAGIRLSKSFNYNKLIARDLWTGRKDRKKKDIFENDILDWGDWFESVVKYDPEECEFYIEELGIVTQKGETCPRRHDMTAYTNTPKVIGNIHLNPIKEDTNG